MTQEEVCYISSRYISYQQEIKRERSEHLISPDRITKKSESAQRDRREAAGFLSVSAGNQARAKGA